ncbi:MAG: hypothetical protein DHS20C12_11600 [Pseudohongiella sp.]|nr:MAG: hypothetical protein DHS20C12_11600 [Pseudohongiella sp.]
MAKSSKIEWTHHTFNPWWGCTKVSPGCKHCYAQTWSKRVGYAIWGHKAERRFFSDTHWRGPIKWNKEAELAGERRRVFCASMADVFERRAELNPVRDRLWALIEATPWLDWLLLTKRPQNFKTYLPWDKAPPNVWLGTTAETQRFFDERIDNLLSVDAKVHFLSCEPLLGALDISHYSDAGIDWVIAGGESGAGARPMNPEWASQLRDQCLEANIPFHFKQWGHWSPLRPVEGKRIKTIDLTNEDDSIVTMFGLGKGNAGRSLEGETWDGFPLQ